MLERGGKREGMVERPNNPEEKVRELQRQLWTCAKRSRSRRFHALYDRIWRGDVLLEAWRRVKANGGAAGVDEVSIRDIEERGAGEYLKEIQNALKAGRYRPSPVRRRYIPKGDGRQRPLGIPTVRDRVVQMATKLVIEPIFEADFQPCSWGFRPRRGATQAMEVIREAGNHGHNVVLDADIRDYFGSIDHGKLMVLVKERISDRRVLKLIGQWLTAGVMEDGTVRETLAGTPQGGVISPLLSNIYLGYLDRIWESRCRHLGILVRYAERRKPIDKVRRLQIRLWRAAKRSPERRFHALYDRVCRGDVLREAWRRVKRNRGAAGVDAETLAAIEQQGVEGFLEVLRQELIEEAVSTAGGVAAVHPEGRREAAGRLGIPTVRDRVVQMAAKLVLEPIFEADFRPCSSGSGRSVERRRRWRPCARRSTRGNNMCWTRTFGTTSAASITGCSWSW